LEVKVKSDGTVETKDKGWNIPEVKMIVIQFRGQLTSTYRYPINPKDAIREIVIRIES